MCCIMRQCFYVDTLYVSWLGLTTLALGWDVTAGIRAVRVQYDTILTTIFSKTYGEDMLQCPTIVVSSCWVM
jgi:hypothetical protein